MGYLMYLTKQMIREALTNVQAFEHELDNLFASYDYSLRDNLGRRNALCSQAQEKELARVLSETFECVTQDGAPGKPDIYIGEINKELECKLTSGNRSSSVSYSLQTDWATLQKKGSLDYLYVLCDKEFEKFCVLYFKDLTTDDFYPPASGSRGKSRMKKTEAMKKCICLHGEYSIQNEKFINNYSSLIKDLHANNLEKIKTQQQKYFESGDNAFLAKNKIKTLKINLAAKTEKQISSLNKKIDNWRSKDSRFTFTLKSLDSFDV